jgi:hypothetical protein
LEYLLDHPAMASGAAFLSPQEQALQPLVGLSAWSEAQAWLLQAVTSQFLQLKQDLLEQVEVFS